MNSLFVIVPGFGEPNVTHKCQILESNLTILNLLKQTSLFSHVHITICIYDSDPTTAAAVHSLLKNAYKNSEGFIKWSIKIHSGIVGQFLLEHANPEDLKPDERFIMILLDDVELTRGLWTSMRWINVFYDISCQRLDVFSPTLSAESKCLFPYMRQRTALGADALSMTSACELFCYILPRTSYERYYRELSPDHPWLWGIDLVLHKHLRFRVGLSHYVSMRHHYQSTPNTSETSIAAFEAMKTYLNKYEETQESLAIQPAVLQDIYVYHRV
jgi:hypothetical protein